MQIRASWDHTLRLWDIKKGATTRRFVGHNRDVLSCAFSAENRQIVSGSRDKTVKLWNTLEGFARVCYFRMDNVCGRAFSVYRKFLNLSNMLLITNAAVVTLQYVMPNMSITGRMQIRHYRERPHRVVFLCALLPAERQSVDRVMRLGQPRQSMDPQQLQAHCKPHWPHWLP